MDRNNSIFYKLTKENENSTTELLCNILRVKYVRDIVLRYLEISAEVIDEIEQKHINTQISNKGSGIPDIIINSPNSYYIIENKIRPYTELRENQKSTYLELINKQNKKHKGYIFLIPEGYKDEVSIKNIEKNEGYEIIIKRWKKLLERLNEMEVQKDSPVIKESIDYLSDVILGCPVDNTLTREEINIFYNPRNIYYSLSILKKYYGLIIKNEKYLIERLGEDFTPSDGAYTFDDINSIGKHLNYKGSMCIFYGFNLNLLKLMDDNYNKYIFSVRFDLNHLKDNYNKDNYNNKYVPKEYENWLYINTDIESIINDNTGRKYFDELIEIIKSIFLTNKK